MGKSLPEDTLRIASLLPAATDILICLGLTDCIFGISHECKVVYEEHGKNVNWSGDDCVHVLNSSLIDFDRADDAAMTQQEIDAKVKANADSLYQMNVASMELVRPSLILTQGLCAVCGPSPKQLSCLKISSHVKVLSLQPRNLSEVLESFVQVAKVCNVPTRGITMKDEFQRRLFQLRSLIHDHYKGSSNREINKARSSLSEKRKPKVLLLEWLDPPYDGGHWVIDQIKHAGCENSFDSLDSCQSDVSKKSKEVSWDKIYKSDPDVVIVACCGFDLDRNLKDAKEAKGAFMRLRAFRENSIYAADGNRYFARPGPSLLGGISIIARCAHDRIGSLSKKIDELDLSPKEGLGWSQVIFDETKQAEIEIEDTVTIANKDDFYKIHGDACKSGKKYYLDPETGYRVFTRIGLEALGKCCGSGCRHCPYNHASVKEEDKAKRIKQPALLYRAGNFCNKDISMIKVLFWSGGKDSFLTLRALYRSNPQKNDFAIVLLTTFDETSRVIANQNIHIDNVVRQAKHLELTLIGVPMHRASSESYISRIGKAMDVVCKEILHEHGIIGSLVFGDLHLDHIRDWRDKELSKLKIPLEYPLWKKSYDHLMESLRSSKVECKISASNVEDVGVGDDFIVTYEKLSLIKKSDVTIDLFGENGEFHTLAKTWVTERTIALGVDK